MFRFLCLGGKERFALPHPVLNLLCLAFTQTAFAQGVPIVRQTDSGGSVLAYSDDGQIPLPGISDMAAQLRWA